MIQEEFHQRQDVFLSVAQRRDKDGDDRQAVIQVLPEMAFADGALQVAIGRGDDPHIHLHVANAPHSADHLVFEHAEEFGLQERRQLADLVEEESSAVTDFKQALLHRLGVSESAFLVAEEFRFHQVFGNGGTVDGHKRPTLPRALVVNRFGYEILSGAALALNQDGGCFAGCDLADKSHQLAHFARNGDHVVVAGALANLAAQRLNFVSQARSFQRVLHGHGQLVEIQRLADEVVGSHLERGFHVIELRIGSHHDHGANVACLFQPIQHIQPAQIRQSDVQQDEVRRLSMGHAQAFLARRRFQRLIAPLLALLLQRPADQLFIIHDENSDVWHLLYFTMKQPPSAGLCATAIGR